MRNGPAGSGIRQSLFQLVKDDQPIDDLIDIELIGHSFTDFKTFFLSSNRSRFFMP